MNFHSDCGICYDDAGLRRHLTCARCMCKFHTTCVEEFMRRSNACALGHFQCPYCFCVNKHAQLSCAFWLFMFCRCVITVGMWLIYACALIVDVGAYAIGGWWMVSRLSWGFDASFLSMCCIGVARSFVVSVAILRALTYHPSVSMHGALRF